MSIDRWNPSPGLVGLLLASACAGEDAQSADFRAAVDAAESAEQNLCRQMKSCYADLQNGSGACIYPSALGNSSWLPDTVEEPWPTCVEAYFPRFQAELLGYLDCVEQSARDFAACLQTCPAALADEPACEGFASGLHVDDCYEWLVPLETGLSEPELDAVDECID